MRWFNEGGGGSAAARGLRVAVSISCKNGQEMAGKRRKEDGRVKA